MIKFEDLSKKTQDFIETFVIYNFKYFYNTGISLSQCLFYTDWELIKRKKKIDAGRIFKKSVHLERFLRNIL